MEFTGVYHKRMGQNPAQVDRGSGELFINPDVWPYLPESLQTFILLHEEGHLKGGIGGQPTADELLADKYAFEKFVGSEKESLKKAVWMLYDSLPGHTSQQWKRIITMYARALEYDYLNFGNKEALEELNRMNAELNGFEYVSNQPYFYSEKSNWIEIVVSAVVALFQAGAKKASENKIESQADILELQNQSTQSDVLADEFIYGKTVNGVDKSLIYGLIVLVLIVGLALYLKRRFSK